MGKKHGAVLVGNGLSVAFNPDLALDAITREVLARMGEADGDDVVAAMREIAERALPEGVTSADDFEALVGAFGAETRTLGSLGTLADLKSPKDAELRDAIQRVAEFAERVRDTGISYVLEVICERSHATRDAAANLHALVRDLLATFDGDVTFGNLNYDTLLLAALMSEGDAGQVADLGDGRRKVEVLVNDEETRSVPALRRTPEDFPSYARVQLLNLHGSLTYWASPDGTRHAKLTRDLLEDGEQWRAVRDGTTDIRPTVVLANPRDKAQHVGEYPFSLAYNTFRSGLDRADHWIIIGYSFRDLPVNAMLREQFEDGEHEPSVLVVTYGDAPSRRRIERAFGWDRDEDGDSKAWLTVIRSGANGVQDTTKWQRFTSA